MTDLVLRTERPEDAAAIHALHASAFPTDAEARLVDALRSAGQLVLSLVAEEGGEVVGHVAFSPVRLDGAEGGLGLAPVAVLEALRRRGIAEGLIHEGLARCARAGATFVVVLGSPRYYPRFGFQPASGRRLRDEYGGGDAFQVLELRAGSLPEDGGLVRYAAAFAAL